MQTIAEAAEVVYNPDDAVDLVGLAIMYSPTVIGAVFSGIAMILAKRVKDQVQNGHTEPLRNDLDAKFDQVNARIDAFTERLDRHERFVGDRIDRIERRFDAHLERAGGA